MTPEHVGVNTTKYDKQKQPRPSLGNYIRGIDYVNAKDENEIGNKFIDFESLCGRDDSFSFDELKDAYVAFREKVCVPEFGYRHEPQCWAAYSTLCVMNRLKGNVIDSDDEDDGGDDAQKKNEIGVQEIETYISLLRARPSSGHIELLSLIKITNIKTCSQAAIADMLVKLRIKFAYDPKDTTGERVYADFLSVAFKRFFAKITPWQCMAVQKEFLDVYMFYLAQLPTLSEEMCCYVGYLVRDMVDNFPDRNPYTGVKDVDKLKSHIAVCQHILCTAEDDVDKLYVDTALKNMIAATTAIGVAKDIFEDWMGLVSSFAERRKPVKSSDGINSMFRIHVFRKMKTENLKPDGKMFEATAKMILRVIDATGPNITKDQTALLSEALDDCIGVFTELTPEHTKTLLNLWIRMIKSGRTDLITRIKNMTEKPVYKKVPWKNFLPEIKEIFATIGAMTTDLMEERDRVPGDYSNTTRAIDDFIETFMKTLKTAKVWSELQKDLVTCVFNCVKISSPHKSELAGHITSRKYITLSPKKDSELIETIQDETIAVIQQSDLTWNLDMACTVAGILTVVTESYNGNGKLITTSQHKKFRQIFMICCEGETIEDKLMPPGEDEHNWTVYYRIYLCNLMQYLGLVAPLKELGDFVPITKRILKWAKVAVEENLDTLKQISFGSLLLVLLNVPSKCGDIAPEIVGLFLDLEECSSLTGLMMTSIYPYNPGAFHSRLQEFLDKIEELKDNDQSSVMQVLTAVADRNPQVFSSDQVGFLLELSLRVSRQMRPSFFPIFWSIAKKNHKSVAPHFKELKNDKKYLSETLALRLIIIGTVGSIDHSYNREAMDHMMTYANTPDNEGFTVAMGQMCLLVKDELEYFEEKYKAKIEKIEQTTRNGEVKTACQNLLTVLQGQNYDEIFSDVMKQQEDLVLLDKKVTATVEITTELREDIDRQGENMSEIQKDVDKLDTKVDNIENDVGETKLKVEEIDNKTMTNAPKWSRDLTKLMNPKSDADWRLLASRLRYTNEDIRGWSQQHDPCMALLSEWYATHKTSEATKGLLTILQEMDRTDAAIIVENAMKASEDVVEDEDFEYASPPPVFLSYQWGIQNEVKLLKQHLEMAGYHCWMDIGQMGGGDKLFEKIDSGIRAAKVIISCTTEKYAQSPNCNREVGLSVNLQKPIIPLLMEKMSWPPKGPVGPVFSEFLFVRFFQRGGEETKDDDQRYWPLPKFQELLMQLSFYVVPDESLIQAEYAKWWAPEPEVIKIDKKKQSNASGGQAQFNSGSTDKTAEGSSILFLSYQWGKQPQVKALYQRLVGVGYTVWMDIYQMGGGDSLYDKIDRGMRGCKVVVSCITPKYALSANCRREVSLADALKKPIIPLLLEQMKWPPDGPMSMAFTELLFINMYRDEAIQTTWTGPKVDELLSKLQEHVPKINQPSREDSKYSKDNEDQNVSQTKSESKGKSAPSPQAKALGKVTPIVQKQEPVNQASPQTQTDVSIGKGRREQSSQKTNNTSGGGADKTNNENEYRNNVQSNFDDKKSKSCILL